MGHNQIAGFQNINLGQVENPSWQSLLKLAKTTKSASSQLKFALVEHKWDIIETNHAQQNKSDLLSI